MTSGERIRLARERAGLTQKELGEKLNISYQNITKWENCARTPRFETLERIANALGIKLDELLPTNIASDESQPQRSNKIRIYRKKCGLSRKELSAKTNIPDSDIEAYERPSNGVFITQEHLETLSSFFNIGQDELLGMEVTAEQMEKKFSENLFQELKAIWTRLNPLGKQTAVERIRELSEVNRYKKDKDKTTF